MAKRKAVKTLELHFPTGRIQNPTAKDVRHILMALSLDGALNYAVLRGEDDEFLQVTIQGPDMYMIEYFDNLIERTYRVSEQPFEILMPLFDAFMGQNPQWMYEIELPWEDITDYLKTLPIDESGRRVESIPIYRQEDDDD